MLSKNRIIDKIGNNKVIKTKFDIKITKFKNKNFVKLFLGKFLLFI